VLTDDWSEHGWALTVAGRREVTRNLTVMIEALRIESRKPARVMDGLDPDQTQNLVQMAFRIHL
jgi:hypothetical protein